MATSCRVGVERPDGSIVSVYVHNDGYLSGVGATLVKHYNSPEQVEQLCELGDLSCLEGGLDELAPEGSFSGGVVSYKRWQGDEDCEAIVSPDCFVYEALARGTVNYVYLYDATGWQYAKLYGSAAPEFQPLAPTAIEEDE